MRKRLDFDKPVPRGCLMECLDIALQHPPGSNNQGWRWVFIVDQEKKKALAGVARTNTERPTSRPTPKTDKSDLRDEQHGRVSLNSADVPQRPSSMSSRGC